jgi:hypothetical protein
LPLRSLAVSVAAERASASSEGAPTAAAT